MATPKTIRKRIASVRNTQKITKAMKMVAAAKLRRAQTRLVNARPYANKMNELLAHMVDLIGEKGHPIFQKREETKAAEFLILSSDRGLCGGFNGNLLRRVETFLKEKTSVCPVVRVSVMGRKGRDFMKSRKRELEKLLPAVREDLRFEESLKLAEDLVAGYTEGRFDEFYLVYNYFRSAISQEVRIERLLPLEFPARPETGYLPEYLYEPSREALLKDLVLRALATIIHRAFLESVTGEFAARMVAMDNATNNSKEMIYDLTLQMNRLRQAAITKELMDIVNGSESLKKS